MLDGSGGKTQVEIVQSNKYRWQTKFMRIEINGKVSFTWQTTEWRGLSNGLTGRQRQELGIRSFRRRENKQRTIKKSYDRRRFITWITHKIIVIIKMFVCTLFFFFILFILYSLCCCVQWICVCSFISNKYIENISR